MKRFLFIFLFFIGSFELIFAVDGVCGNSDGKNYYLSDDISDLCSVGTASVVSGSGPWSWDCLGTGFDEDVFCSANEKVDCVGSWDYTYGSCSAIACGTSGTYNKFWTTTTPSSNDGLACPNIVFLSGMGDACSALACGGAMPSLPNSLQVEPSSIWYNNTLLKRGSCRHDSRTGKLTVSTEGRLDLSSYKLVNLYIDGISKGNQDISSPFFNSFRKTLSSDAIIELKARTIFGVSVTILTCSVKDSFEFNQNLDLFGEELSGTLFYKTDEFRDNKFFEVTSEGTLFFRDTSYYNVRVDSVDSKLVDAALNLHNIYEIDSVNDGLNKLNDISILNARHDLDIKSVVGMKDNCYEGVFARFDYRSDDIFKLDKNRSINKTYTNYLGGGNLNKCDDTADQKLRSKIKISLVNITRNLTVYQILPKYLVDEISGINFINDGGAQRFISDKDPIIGWYFNDSIDNGEIILELPGNSSGGTIILAEEPILFNDGELIVNYRVSSCNVGEVNLFDLVSLDGSKIYAPGTSFYKVCVTHLTEDLEFGSDDNYYHLGNYIPFGNYSLDSSLIGDPVDINVERTDLYWSLLISKENPSGSYSCLGSVDNLSSSLFGDCLFNEDNRIWLHLGEDLLTPVTSLSTLYLSHTVPIVLNAVDNLHGSGIEKIYYCVDSDGTCDPLLGTVIFGDEAKFQVTCPGLVGCVKFVNFLSFDVAGNVEVVNSESIKMIDAGSSCQSDCTVKPDPGRYLAECNGLNLCNYYKFDMNGLFDDGDYVSNQCDLAVSGSYVKYNSTHEILCPAGPFRESIFVDELLDLSNSFCDNLHFRDFPAIIDGQTVTLKLYVCLDN
jgi:hypothetical protein